MIQRPADPIGDYLGRAPAGIWVRVGYLDRSHYVENKSVENKSVENKSVENKSVENKSVENKSVENRSVESSSRVAFGDA